MSADERGLRELFRQFSFPGGIPSHAAPETPGSIHEGGELGYALTHAYGAAFDNPDLVVCCVVGDGEAETGPLAASWHSNKFLNPKTDGAVLPILHLNGYKIANPTVLARIPEDELVALLEGYGHRPILVTGDEPEQVHQDFAAALDDALDDIARLKQSAARPKWPMIVLRTPKGWTGPKEVDGLPVEGTWRSHQVPIAEARQNPEHLQLLEDWMRSYRPEELFDQDGRLVPELAALPPAGDRRMSASPHTTGELGRDLVLPDFRDYAVEVDEPGTLDERGDAGARRIPARRDRAQPRDLPPLRPRRDRVEPALRRLRGHEPGLGGGAAADRRGARAGGTRGGGAVGASLPGLAGGLPAHGQARLLQLLRGVHPHRRLDVQPAREVAEGDAATSPGAARSRRSTTCSRRTSGARTTTASRTRTRASSTT